ncbi:MAG: hypothetical protein AMXMBFR48_28540 [Ignavibacteriales bacterium]|jgi:DNA-binding response OmpR family regulator
MTTTLPKILILEDDPENQRFIYYLLYKKYHPVICSVYDEAVQRLDEHDYTAMIVDIGLQGEKHGLDFIRLVRTQGRNSSVPVICCTAFAAGEDRMTAFSAGADVFLPKPVPNPVMLETLERIISPAPQGEHLAQRR